MMPRLQQWLVSARVLLSQMQAGYVQGLQGALWALCRGIEVAVCAGCLANCASSGQHGYHLFVVWAQTGVCSVG
jgi:hypothetical protein